MFSLSLSASAVNAWRLRQHINGKKEPYLSFLRELVTDMLSTHGKTPNRRQPSKQDKSRHDNICHLIVPISDEGGKKVVRRCSRHCFQTKEKDFKTSFKCEKCDAPLQVLCFKDFILANFNKKHLYIPLPSLTRSISQLLFLSFIFLYSFHFIFCIQALSYNVYQRVFFLPNIGQNKLTLAISHEINLLKNPFVNLSSINFFFL